jgi:hypothetical protein
VGLALLLSTLVLVTVGQSWASVLVQSGEASINLTAVTRPVGITEVTPYSNSTSINEYSQNSVYGSNTSLATNDGATLYAYADAGVESTTMFSYSGLFWGSSSATQKVYFTANNTGLLELLINPGGFSVNTSPAFGTPPVPSYYSAAAYATLSIYNTSNTNSGFSTTDLMSGPLFVSLPFNANDPGYYTIEVFADAQVESVPEPSTTVLIGIGLAVVAFARRKMIVRS